MLCRDDDTDVTYCVGCSADRSDVHQIVHLGTQLLLRGRILRLQQHRPGSLRPRRVRTRPVRVSAGFFFSPVFKGDALPVLDAGQDARGHRVVPGGRQPRVGRVELHGLLLCGSCCRRVGGQRGQTGLIPAFAVPLHWVCFVYRYENLGGQGEKIRMKQKRIEKEETLT